MRVIGLRGFVPHCPVAREQFLGTWVSSTWPIASSKSERKGEYARKAEVTILCNLITGVTSRHLCHVVLVFKMKWLSAAHSQRKRLTPTHPRRQELLGVIIGSPCYNEVVANDTTASGWKLLMSHYCITTQKKIRCFWIFINK